VDGSELSRVVLNHHIPRVQHAVLELKEAIGEGISGCKRCLDRFLTATRAGRSQEETKAKGHGECGESEHVRNFLQIRMLKAAGWEKLGTFCYGCGIESFFDGFFCRNG